MFCKFNLISADYVTITIFLFTVN